MSTQQYRHFSDAINLAAILSCKPRSFFDKEKWQPAHKVGATQGKGGEGIA